MVASYEAEPQLARERSIEDAELACSLLAVLTPGVRMPDVQMHLWPVGALPTGPLSLIERAEVLEQTRQALTGSPEGMFVQISAAKHAQMRPELDKLSFLATVEHPTKMQERFIGSVLLYTHA